MVRVEDWLKAPSRALTVALIAPVPAFGTLRVTVSKICPSALVMLPVYGAVDENAVRRPAAVTVIGLVGLGSPAALRTVMTRSTDRFTPAPATATSLVAPCENTICGPTETWLATGSLPVVRGPSVASRRTSPALQLASC